MAKHDDIVCSLVCAHWCPLGEAAVLGTALLCTGSCAVGSVHTGVRWEEKKVEYDTRGSQVITDLSTNRTCGCLTSQFGRDVVLCMW